MIKFRAWDSEDEIYTHNEAGLSDSQLYKQAGNSVTVPVIKAIAEKMELRS